LSPHTIRKIITNNGNIFDTVKHKVKQLHDGNNLHKHSGNTPLLGAFGQTVGQVVRHQYRKVYEVDNGNTSLPRKIIKSTFFFVI
jgi:hypothetical protein